MLEIFVSWLKARRLVLFYTAAIFCFFIIIYALNGYEWSVAGYAVILSMALGFTLGIWDFILFKQKNKELELIAGKFPTSVLPESENATEENFHKIILMLETERLRLEKENAFNRRDAEEYYTLWTHQIKTPIAAAQLLLDSGGGKDGLEQELFKISQYVDMALQYRRLSSMENDLILEAFSLSYLVKQAVKACAPLFIYKGLGLDISNISGKIVTDKKWFCFVIEQLLTNAAKYTPKGTIKISSKEPETLTIEDCGTGIPKEDLPRVFERGFTGAHGRTERSSTGIGLYLSRRVLLKLGFGINVESEAGKGTRVILHLSQNRFETE